MVVMAEHNSKDILPMARLTLKDEASIRFIEEMPFNGGNKEYQPIKWNFTKIIEHIQSEFPEMCRLEDEKNSTSYNYKY